MSDILSASQIETFRLCQRKWAWGYVEGIKSPANKYAAWGTELHSVNESFIKFGTPPPDTPHGRIAMAGFKFLPVASHPSIKNLVSEGEFRVQSPGGIWYRGYRDVFHVGPFTHEYEDENKVKKQDFYPEIPVVTDFKSTGDFKWSKSKDELRKDVQASLYAYEAFVSFPGAPVVGLQWINYLRSEPPRIKRVHLIVLKDSVLENVSQIDRTAHELLVVKRSGKRAMDLPPTISACEAYGGCPHIERCNITPQQRMSALMAQRSVLDRMAQHRVQNGQAPGAPPPPQQNFAAGPPGAPQQNFAAGPPGAPQGHGGAVSPPPPPQQAGPPQGPPAGPPAEAAPKRRTSTRKAAAPPPGANGVAGPAAYQGPPQGGPPPGPPPGPPQQAWTPSPAAQAPQGPPAGPPASPQAVQSAAGGLTLYVGCQPRRAEVVTLAELVQAAQQQLGIQHYLDKGVSSVAPVLQHIVSTLLQDGPLNVCLDMRSSEGANFVSTLEAMASEVVRGG